MRTHLSSLARTLRRPLFLTIGGLLVALPAMPSGTLLYGYITDRESTTFDTNVVSDTITGELGDLEGMPAFGEAAAPVSSVPNWGAMRTPAEWNRSFADMSAQDVVPLPPYALALASAPVRSLLGRSAADIPILTAKLVYSTRFLGTYDLDAGEFSGNHPGIDIKLALGTPVLSIGGGRVVAVRHDDILGNHVLIAHAHPQYGMIVSAYGHLDTVAAQEGQYVSSGDEIGTVGMTGNTSAPHLHLQIDYARGDPARHIPYRPAGSPSRTQAARRTINPVNVIPAMQTR